MMPLILWSRLVLLICWANLSCIFRSSIISFFSCHIWSCRRLRAAAARLLLFLFCTVDRLTAEIFCIFWVFYSHTRFSSLVSSVWRKLDGQETNCKLLLLWTFSILCKLPTIRFTKLLHSGILYLLIGYQMIITNKTFLTSLVSMIISAIFQR